MNMKTLFLILLVCSLAGAGVVNAAFDRALEPIVVLGSECGKFLGQSIDDVRVYVYAADADAWSPIPFQVDEFIPNDDPEKDKKVVWQGDGILTSLDEIVFMGKDLGDQAADVSVWPEDVESKNYSRYEIVVSDPVSGQNRYAYIYYSSTLSLNGTAYISY